MEELEGVLGAARRGAPSGSASGGGVAVAAAGRGTARESAPGEVVELSSRENSASLGPGAAAPSAPCCATLVSRGEAAPPPAGASALQEAAGPVSSSNQYPTIEALLAAGFRVRDRVVTLEELDQGGASLLGPRSPTALAEPAACLVGVACRGPATMLCCFSLSSVGLLDGCSNTFWRLLNRLRVPSMQGWRCRMALTFTASPALRCAR